MSSTIPPPGIPTKRPSQAHDIDESLLEPWRYIMEVPGKNIRGKLIKAFNVWLNIPQEKVKDVGEVVRNLHTASLLVDDIEDNSKLRRGIPVAHSIYGIPHTLNTANYVYILALEKCRNLGNLDALDVFIDELLNLHRGQGQDILWRDTLTCPTEQEYIKMVKDKTGGLFRLAVGLMKAFSSDCKLDFNPLLNTLAIYFQIRDDYMNLVSEEYHNHKSFCEDLTEGKFSFPIIHGIQTKPHDNRLLNILKQRTEDIEVKKHAVEYLNKIGSMNYTYEKVNSLKTEINDIIDDLGGHDSLKTLVATLHEKIPTPQTVSTIDK
jgi:geranylgeranyl diphosphate synthase, type III